MIHHLESYDDGYSDGKSETLKQVFEEVEILWLRKGKLGYLELTQKLKLLASPDTKPSVLHKDLETK